MSKKPTQQELIARGLKSKGWTEVDSPSRKYRKFLPPPIDQQTLYPRWLGKNGAVRIGATISQSMPMSEIKKRTWIKAGEEA